MTSLMMSEDTAADTPTELEERAWVGDFQTVVDSAAIPWNEEQALVKLPGSAIDLVPNLEVRLGREWGRAIRAADIHRHAIRAWFDACAANGYELLKQSVDIDPDIRGGVPVLKGTGFTVAQAIVELAESCSVEDMAKSFDLDAERVRETLFALSLLLQRPCQR
jgi:uncharacterized protein (DUF433 family)